MIRYDKSDESIFCSVVLFLEKTEFDPLFFVFYSVIQIRYSRRNKFLNNFSMLDGLLRTFYLVIIAILLLHHHIYLLDHRPAECGTLSDDACPSTILFVLLHMKHQSISSFEHFSFFFRLFNISTQFLSVLGLNLLSSS